MTTPTPKLKIPYWAAAQEQPWLPENWAKNIIDVLLPGVVVTDALNTPPASPAAGSLYIVAAIATGAWAGWEDTLAAYIDGAWLQITPAEGWMFYKLNTKSFVVFDAGWGPLTVPAPYDTALAFDGSPSASQVMGRAVIPRNLVLPANFAGSIGIVGTNPTATYLIDIRDDGVSIGSASISTAGAFTFTTVGGVAVAVAAGSLIEFVAPATVDATATDITLSLEGSA